MEQQELTINQKRYRARKEKAKRTTRPKVMNDPLTGNPITLPTQDLPKDASLPAIVQHVNKLQDVVLAQATVIAEYSQFFKGERQKKQVDLDIVQRLASWGCDQTTIGTLLGFDWHILVRKTRPDIEQAYQLGRAEVKGALFKRQLETAFTNGKDSALMQIFLGKQLLGQKPDSALQANIQVNVDTGASDLRRKIAEEKRKHDEAAQAAFAEAVDAHCVDVGPGDSEPEKSGTGS